MISAWSLSTWEKAPPVAIVAAMLAYPFGIRILQDTERSSLTLPLAIAAVTALVAAGLAADASLRPYAPLLFGAAWTAFALGGALAALGERAAVPVAR
jgi:uncharacterized integral membrane protein